MRPAITTSLRLIRPRHNYITPLLQLVDIVVRKWRLGTGTGLGLVLGKIARKQWNGTREQLGKVCDRLSH